MTRQLTQEKKLFRDMDFVLLNVNAALVIIGYGLAVYTHSASVFPMKIIKSFFLVISAFSLMRGLKLNKNVFSTPSVIYLIVFSFWVMLMSFFSENVFFSISKSMNFLTPFIYVYIALHNILNKFDVLTVLRGFIKSMNIIYFIPIFAYLSSGAGFGQTNIYGQSSEAGHLFVSNHYGWASSIFVLSAIDIWLNARPGRAYKIFLLIFSLVALYIALISGNRASWLSLIFALLIFIVRLKNIRTDFKIFLALVPIAAIIWFSKIPESSLNTRLEITETQFEHGEARFNTAQLAVHRFNEDKLKWFTGAGMFNYEPILHGGGLTDYHNSYFEVLFGGGIVLFLLFINFMVLRPLYHYIIFYSKYFILFPPLMIIPFFESNITGGQFLFFPWFIFMLLFNIIPSTTPASQKTVLHRQLAARGWVNA